MFVAGRVVLEDLPVVGIPLKIAFAEFSATREARAREFVEDLNRRMVQIERKLEPPEQELVFRGMLLSVEARTADKIHALAAAVASGLTADATDLMLAHMALDAIGSLDEAQIAVLRVVATSPPGSQQVGGFTVDSIGNRASGLDQRLLGPVLSLLQAKGLVSRFDGARLAALEGKAPQDDLGLYSVTSLGAAINELLDTPTTPPV